MTVNRLACSLTTTTSIGLCRMAVARLTKNSTVRLRTGYYMPVIGLGVYRNYTTRESVAEALYAGYRLVDSAQAYRNEAHVEQGLRDTSVSRDDVFIITKIISKFHGYESTLKAVNESLERYQFQYIDLFLIHNPHSGIERRLATYKALQDAKLAGKIRSVGVSNYGIKHLEEIMNAGYEMPVVNQIELHPFCQQRPIVAFCREHEIIVQAYSPMVQGTVDHSVFLEIAEKHRRDPGQILIRWSLQKGFVPLPKSANSQRIRSNLDVFDFELDNEDMQKLNCLDRGKEGAVTWNPVDAP